MSESTALYRKYRSKNFDEVIGQSHVIDVLRAAFQKGKVFHAYLLSGGRGIGKTSVARIIASELGTQPSDIYEIDAASNRGIDDIRELREGVRTLPFDSKYKVYIIDEVHMLTKEAFNALLKTLEEPPAHVVFILATTELDRVPDTIISRCQTFVFKKPTETILRDFIMETAKKEGVILDAGGAALIALLADGSFRDALGTLEKVASFAGTKKISQSEIERITGAPESAHVDEFILAIAEKDIERGFAAVRAASSANIDMEIYAKLILMKFRLLLVFRYAPGTAKEVKAELSEGDRAFFEHILKEKTNTITSATLVVLLEAYQGIRRAFIKELPLELALIEILGQDK